jgi:hypothetical protein
MVFDITKTETFMPGIWIMLKYVYICIVVSTLLNCNRPLSQIHDNEFYLNYIQRMVLVWVIISVVYEYIYDAVILQKLDSIQKIARLNIDKKNMVILTDFICISMVLLYHTTLESMEIRKIDNNTGKNITQNYVHTPNTPFYSVFFNMISLWCFISTLNICMEILLITNNIKMIQCVRRLTNCSFIFSFLLVTCMAYNITSNTVLTIFSTHTIHDLLYRFLFYTVFVIARWYTEGFNYTTLLKNTDNRCLFSWTLLVHFFLLYISIFLVITCYLILYVSTTNITKQPPLPQHYHPKNNELTSNINQQGNTQTQSQLVIDDKLLQKLNEHIPSTRRKNNTVNIF